MVRRFVSTKTLTFTPQEGTMTHGKKSKTVSPGLKSLVQEDRDLMKELVREALQSFLEAEMTEFLGASLGERTDERKGYRAGYYRRSWITRVGKIELSVPRDRSGQFSTELFDRYQRSEKALFSVLAEMYVQGVSTRRVKAVTEELCGHGFSASTVSAINKTLDATLTRFASRPLEEAFPYLILDARYEKVREEGVIRSRAVQIAIGIDTHGQRHLLAVELANRESRSSWKDFLIGLKKRGLSGVTYVVSDHHEGLKQAIAELLSEALWQRCYVHYLRNALDHLPKTAEDSCLKELRELYDRHTLTEAQEGLLRWIDRWQESHPRFVEWVEETIGETFTFLKLPRAHHRSLKSTNVLERLNEEIKRRTRVVRIFPNPESCLRLIRALCSEVHDHWVSGKRYLDMTGEKPAQSSKRAVA